MTKPTTPWPKLKRISSAIMDAHFYGLDALLEEAAKHDPKWLKYAETAKEYRTFLREMVTDNRELLYSQFDGRMRERALSMDDEQVDALVRAGKL